MYQVEIYKDGEANLFMYRLPNDSFREHASTMGVARDVLNALPSNAERVTLSANPHDDNAIITKELGDIRDSMSTIAPLRKLEVIIDEI